MDTILCANIIKIVASGTSKSKEDEYIIVNLTHSLIAIISLVESLPLDLTENWVVIIEGEVEKRISCICRELIHA